MTTVAIGINKNNFMGLARYISSGISTIVAFHEQPKFWQVTSVAGNIKNEFMFDKRDFSSSTEILSALVSAIKL